MAKIGFVVNGPDGRGADLGDLLVPREFFTAGSLYWCGRDFLSVLGDSAGGYRSTPAQFLINGSTNAAHGWKQITPNYGGFSGIKTDGTLWSCAYNIGGTVGDGTLTARSSPVQTVAGGTNWKQVSGSSFGVSAIKSDGTLWGWGDNRSGGLGDNTITTRYSPVQTVAGGTNWKQVSVGDTFTSAIKTDGTLWTWGYNREGELGDSTRTYRSSPAQTVAGGTNWKQVSSGYENVAAIKTDGTLWVWGADQYGQCAQNSTTSYRLSPVQTVARGTNWKQVSCGTQSIGAIKTDGTLWVWGRNLYGELGDSTTVGRSSPVQTATSGTNWKQVSSGSYNMAAIKTDGTLWVWGRDNYGQLGDSTTTNKSSPIQTIIGGTNWKYAQQSPSFLLALTDDS